MSTNYLTRKVFKGLDSVVKVLTWIGNVAIAVITLIFMIDVCGRAFLNKPLYGSNELIELTMILLGFAIVYATWTKQHVKMDILSPRLPRRTQTILTSIGSLLEFVISAVIAYEVLIKALYMLKIHEVSPFLSIPMGPPVLALSISFFVSCLTSLLQAVNAHVSQEKSEGGFAI
jgi:TRAP-type C4-dicarboxylate transport system permease small subunit